MITERMQGLVDAQVEGSPRARELIAQLEGRRMRIAARHTPWQMTLHANQGRLELSRETSSVADVTLAGTPLALMALMREEPAAVIRRGDVTLTGDGEAGARFQELAQLLRPDLEAGLARIVGDIPAFGVGSLVRKALEWGRATASTQASNVGEYLAHERRVLVPRAEAQQFIDEVDALREQADRLEARVTSLESRAADPRSGDAGTDTRGSAS
jgi:ubiquinone biosynthesis accessory factor UbiJ